MAETTKRSDVEIMIVWNPDTGALDLKFDGAQALHVIGILSFAAHVLAAKQVEPKIESVANLRLWKRQ